MGVEEEETHSAWKRYRLVCMHQQRDREGESERVRKREGKTITIPRSIDRSIDRKEEGRDGKRGT